MVDEQEARKAPIKFGEVIRTTRKELNMTREELAAECRISEGYLKQIENGESIPADETVIKELAAILGLDLLTLFSLAGRLPNVAKRYLKKRPTLLRLVLHLVDRDLSEQEISRLIGYVPIVMDQ